MSDLEVYDLTQVYAHLIANQIIKPIAKHIYPDNELKQEHYNQYLYAEIFGKRSQILI